MIIKEMFYIPIKLKPELARKRKTALGKKFKKIMQLYLA
jgi:hypothetical protein